MIRAAVNAGCRILYSEDLQHGRRIEGLEIANPFQELSDQEERKSDRESTLRVSARLAERLHRLVTAGSREMWTGVALPMLSLTGQRASILPGELLRGATLFRVTAAGGDPLSGWTPR